MAPCAKSLYGEPSEKDACVKKGYGHGKKDCPRLLGGVPFQPVVCPGKQGLLEVVGGKYGGAVIGFRAGEGLPLEGAHGKDRVEGDQGMYGNGKEPCQKNTEAFRGKT